MPPKPSPPWTSAAVTVALERARNCSATRFGAWASTIARMFSSSSAAGLVAAGQVVVGREAREAAVVEEIREGEALRLAGSPVVTVTWTANSPDPAFSLLVPETGSPIPCHSRGWTGP